MIYRNQYEGVKKREKRGSKEHVHKVMKRMMTFEKYIIF
jgi:hypothetical protein